MSVARMMSPMNNKFLSSGDNTLSHLALVPLTHALGRVCVHVSVRASVGSGGWVVYLCYLFIYFVFQFHKTIVRDSLNTRSRTRSHKTYRTVVWSCAGDLPFA